MPTEKKKGVKMEIRHNMVDIVINISIKPRNIWIALIISICIFTILASSHNENTREILVDALLWVLQVLAFGEARLGK